MSLSIGKEIAFNFSQEILDQRLTDTVLCGAY